MFIAFQMNVQDRAIKNPAPFMFILFVFKYMSFEDEKNPKFTATAALSLNFNRIRKCK